MKLKLDENLGARGADFFRKRGHDVATVFDENLGSCPDQHLANICHQEERCLITLDMDFANTLLFHPSDYSGIAVLRLPPKANSEDIVIAMHTLEAAFSINDIAGKLWIVQRGRVREHDSSQ